MFLFLLYEGCSESATLRNSEHRGRGLVFLLVAGGVLMALGAVTLILVFATPRDVQTPLSDLDYVMRSGAILGLLLGFILIVYALPKL